MGNRLVYKNTFSPCEGLVNKTEKDFRNEICLNGYWDFQPIQLPESYEHGKGIAPDLPMPDNDSWCDVRIKIPSPWNINAFPADKINNLPLAGPDHRNYPSYPKEWDNVKMAWMRKTVVIPENWTDKQIKLYFEAVAGHAVIYVNGKKVGENFDIFLPFDIDISDNVKPGEQVEVLVGVRSYTLFDDNSTTGRRILPAGSMWGTHIAGIWQDVYLLSLPKINVSDVYVKPLVSKNILEFEVTVENNTEDKINLSLQGDINEWKNLAGTDINSAPVPSWELGEKVLEIEPTKFTLAGNSVEKVVLQVPIKEELKYWTPETPNLYSALLTLKTKKQNIDLKYERFGWREWTLRGTTHCLNGKPYELRGDSWHFTGIPQMTRRYAWAWFTAIKGMNGNAVRPHAQVYPRFYLDMADEMGICVLDETANWASDGGPKFDSDLFWENSKYHLKRLVLRDRNHASVFGWSISNENKPVILYVFNRPELMPLQKKAWEEWRDIVREIDPTRPWISSDGEEDGQGILPVTMGHYGGNETMKEWINIGKPWGVGEHSMAYYGTPEQVSNYNGERAYESQLGRMEGLANECYNLISAQRRLGVSYSTVFNMIWYSLKPLPLGKKDLTQAPNLENDGVFFGEYKEGVPGVQPERIGPYCTTLNPGYDPSLPLYDPWPMYDAIRAANAPFAPAWSPYASIDKDIYNAPSPTPAEKNYKEVVFVGEENCKLNNIMTNQGVIFVQKVTKPSAALYIIDGSSMVSDKDFNIIKSNVFRGADVWIWGITPKTESFYNTLLPKPVKVDDLSRSSFIPKQRSWLRGLNNSDFYFCELQKSDVSKYSLKGELVEEGQILLNACKTDWRMWNHCPEVLKTASVLRSESECTSATPVFVKYQSVNSCFYISTLDEFSNSDKGYKTLSAILKNAGIPCKGIDIKSEDMFFLRDDHFIFPVSSKNKFIKKGNESVLEFYVYSPRPLDNLLIEPNMPKLTFVLKAKDCKLLLNDKYFNINSISGDMVFYNELPLFKGWNKFTININGIINDDFEAFFRCYNNKDFLDLIKVSFANSGVN